MRYTSAERKEDADGDDFEKVGLEGLPDSSEYRSRIVVAPTSHGGGVELRGRRRSFHFRGK